MITMKKPPVPYNANQYQRDAHQFATYGGNELYPVLGLAEEAGEVCGKVAKYIRKHSGITPKEGREMGDTFAEDNAKLVEDIEKELGDCCWMIAEIATTFGFNLGDIMNTNINKLKDRLQRGVIVGEGDNR